VTSADLQLLSLLEAIDRDSRVTQRDLARNTGLNVAKVNFLLKRLADKGHVKLRNISQNPNKLRYLYLLTPQGALEKTRLAYGFMLRNLREYADIQNSVLTSIHELTHEGVDTIALFGATDLAAAVIRITQEAQGPSISYVLDDDATPGSSFHGVPIIRPEATPEDVARIVICHFNGTRSLDDLIARFGGRIGFLGQHYVSISVVEPV
jgi:EPS-associated MarR family transcriptional regulator